MICTKGMMGDRALGSHVICTKGMMGSAHWTNLRTTAGNTICKGLGKSRIHTADLSWNAWYSDPTTGDDAAVQGLAWMLKRSQSLTHLDLSHSRIAAPDVEVVAKALAKNKAVMGLHMQGNAGSCNAHGFLRVNHGKKSKTSSKPNAPAMPRTNRPSSPRPAGDDDGLPVSSLSEAHVFSRILVSDRLPAKDRDWKACSNCWICERWSEHRFCFKPGTSDKVAKLTDSEGRSRVSLRSAFDGFAPHPMARIRAGHG